MDDMNDVGDLDNTAAIGLGHGQVRHRVVATSIGEVTLVARGDALIRVLLPGADLVTAEGGSIQAPSDDRLMDEAQRQLEDYVAGARREFDLPMDLQPEHTTAFERDAWLALATIPYGETISYAAQAERIGRPGAFRAVGAANGRNPLPLLLPCHRVVGADGSLVGFGGGLALKRALLDLESGVQQLPLG